jgi:hypothetical protein
VEMGMDISTTPPRVVREIGTGPHKYLDGRPLMASGANAQAILERMQKLCAAYGTKIEIRDGIGIATIPVS